MALVQGFPNSDEDNSSDESYISEEEDEEYEEDEVQGYTYEFVDDVSPDQECPVCLLPMRNAVQTAKCGHRFCRTCLKRSSRQGNLYCPSDRQPVRKYFRDTAWNRVILSLRVKCVLNRRGCDWIGQVGHIKVHELDCPYEEKECGGCGEAIQRRHMKKHTDEECPQRIVACDHCDQRFAFSEKQQHEEKFCRKFPLSCLNNCGETGIPREMLKSHLDHKCPMTEVVCPYSEAGCPFQDMRVYLNDHLEASMENHLQMTWSTFESTKMKLECTRMELNGVKLKLNSLEDLRLTSQTFMSFIAESRDRNRSLEERIKVLEEKKATRRKKSEKNEDWRETRADVVSYRQYCTPSKEKCDYDDLFD